MKKRPDWYSKINRRVKRVKAALLAAVILSCLGYGGQQAAAAPKTAHPSGTSAAAAPKASQKQGPPAPAAVTTTAEPKATPEPTAAVTITPTVTPTAAPTVTPAGASGEEGALSAPAEGELGGLISKPDHPDAVSHDKLIFIGDSRTEGIRDAVNDDSIWSCLSAMGYAWMTSTGVPQIENEIEDNTAVIILMGVNDPHNVNNYVNYINVKASEWADLGAKTYFVSVGPVENDPYVTNQEIEDFNATMQANLIGVNYIDVYSYLVTNGFTTLDGIHYPSDVSIAIYNYIVENLEESRSGIWG